MSTAIQPQPAHEREGGVWAYISPSRLNLFLKCPLAFRLRYIDGIRTPTSPSLFIGKSVHSSLERHYRHRQLGIPLDPQQVVSSVTESWDEAVADEDIAFASSGEEMKCKQQAADLVAAYLAQVPADEPQPLAVEATMQAPLVDPFTGEDLGIPLLGVVDLVMPNEAGPLICDFKTSGRSSPPLEVSHEIQLTSYSYIYGQLTGERESGLEIRSLIKTKTPKIECHRYPARTEQHYSRLFAVVREYLDALDAGRFNYRPSWSGCGMCDFRDSHCRDWQG